MDDLRKAAEMALEALENTTDFVPVKSGLEREVNNTIQALRQALAQPEQEQKTPLKVLNLTVFTENRLRNGRVYDVETLKAMTNRDILAIPDMGKKALKEVMEALDVYAVNTSQKRVDETAKREHEPVAWMHELADGHGYCVTKDESGYVDNFTDTYKTIPLYTAPTKREWVGLTEADKQEAFDETQEASGGFWEFADYIDTKLKEKNT